MTQKKRNLMLSLAAGLLFVAMCGVSINFIREVEHLLWENSVKNILESTARGATLFQRGYLKELEMLNMLAHDLGNGVSSNSDRIRDKLKTFLTRTNSVSVLVFEDGSGFLDSGQAVMLTPEERERVDALRGKSGLLFPRQSRGLEGRTFTIYTSVTFSDGRGAVLFMGNEVESLYMEYTLSFYNNTGFSYIVAQNGDIAMHPVHPSCSQTFSNVFEIISEKENDAALVQSFRESLKNGRSGVAVFSNSEGEKNVFCYAAMPRMDGWSVVSIVPNAEIMREANAMIREALVICFLGIAGVLAVFLVYRRMNNSYQKQIFDLAYTDRLTGIRNFSKFTEDGDRLLRAPGAPLYAMLSIDMLNFKIFNDVMGYAEGDALLKEFPRFLKRNGREGGLIARRMADRFVVLLPYRERDELTTYCAGLSRAVRVFLASRELSYRQDLRVGICCVEDCDADLADVNALFDRANMALKAIKYEGGRGRAWNFYDHAMRDRILREKRLETRMEEALSDGEFLIYIQPKYNLAPRALAGGEVLVRWKDRDDIFLSPGEFIPLFEKNRFITRIDRYMLESTCRLLREWMAAGLRPLPLSVNVSRVQFYTPEFVDTYIRMKTEYGIPDGLLELEFTESISVENIELFNSVVRRLRQAGFRCSIDDFGAGYSSLNMLKDLPVDTLKLDGGFFRFTQDDERARTVVRHMLNLAAELRMGTVAEGVETPEQVEFLERAGCDVVQGYVFGKPMPAAEFAELLESAAGRADIA